MKQKSTEHHYSNILIVDDDPSARLLASKAFSDFECSISHASGGYEAIKKISQGFFDLIVLDWVMPDIDGGSALKKVHSSLFFDPLLTELWAGRELSIVSYSAHKLHEMNRPLFKHFKFIDHWQKPLSMNELKSLVRKIQAIPSREK